MKISIFRSVILAQLLIACISLQAQQTSLFNTYSYDLMQLNIAAAGRTCLEANLNYRSQWMGIQDAPKLYQLNAGMSLGKSSGLGLRVAQQSVGLMKMNNVTFGYSYKVKLSGTSKLHLGIGAAWQQNQFAANKAQVIDANDASLGSNQTQYRSNNFDVEAGALFLGDKLTLGLSAQHLYNTNRDLASAAYHAKPQLSVVGAYKFNKGKSIELEPWLVDRYVVSGVNQVEGILNVRLKQMLTIGAGYRLNYGYIALAAIELGKFRICYSFDYGSGKGASSLGSSQQLLLGFDLCRKKNKSPEPVVETPTLAPEPVVVKEEPKKEKPVVTKEQPKVEAPKIDLVAEQRKQQLAAVHEINRICEEMIFEVNKTILPVSKSSELDKIASLITGNNLKVAVIGYASKDGNPTINKMLSDKRAIYVKSELVKRGVAASSIQVQGKGSSSDPVISKGGVQKTTSRTVRIEITP